MKLFLFIFAFVSLIGAAQYSITSGEVDSSGWVLNLKFVGLDTGGTWRTGVNPRRPIADSARATVKVWSPGFGVNVDSTGKLRTAIGTKGARKRWPHSENDGAPYAYDWYDGGDTARIRINLSEQIYTNDVCTLSTLIGVYVDGTDTLAATTNLTLTNSSTITYPVAYGNWTYPARYVVSDSFYLRMAVFSGYADSASEVAAVVFSVTDGIATWRDTINTMVKLQRYKHPDWIVRDTMYDSIPVLEYWCKAPVSVFAQDSVLKCNFKTYPHIGIAASCHLSSDTTIATQDVLPGPQYVLCDKNQTYPRVVAVVDSASDGTGAACVLYSAFDSASPPAAFAALYLARNAIQVYRDTANAIEDTTNMNASIIFLKKGTYKWLGAVTGTRGLTHKINCLVLPFPGVARADVVIDSVNGDKDVAEKANLHNLTFTKNYAGSLTSSPTTWISYCTIRKTGGILFGANPGQSHLTNCTVDSAASGALRAYSTNNQSIGIVRSNIFAALNGAVQTHVFSGNVVHGGSAYFITHYTGQTCPSQRVLIIGCNKIYLSVSSTSSIWDNDSSLTSGAVYIAQNLIEQRVTQAGAIFTVARYNTNASTVNNVIFKNNTIRGQRNNICYNDPYLMTVSEPAWRINWFLVGNVWTTNLVTEWDLHGAPVQDSMLYGNWRVKNGVGSKSDFVHQSDEGAAANTGYEFPGVNSYASIQYLADDTLSPGFAADKSFIGTGAGHGDYRPKSSSVIFRFTGNKTLPWDLNGNPRRLSNGAPGSFESHDTLSRFYGSQSIGTDTFAVPCSTLAKVVGDSIKIYLQTKSGFTWTTQDSSAWTTAVLKDTLIARSLTASTEYPIRLKVVTTGTFGHTDTTQLDTITTASGAPAWDTLVIDSVFPDSVMVGDTLSIYISASGLVSVDTLYLGDSSVTPFYVSDSLLKAIIPAGLDTGVYDLIVSDTVSSDTLDSAFTVYDEGTVYLCTLTVSAGTGGSVSPSGAQSDTCGDTVQVVATPNAGYLFLKWTRSGTAATILDSLNDTTKVFRTDSEVGTVTVTANFTQRANHILVWNSSSSTNMNLASNYWDSTTAAAADTILSGDTLLWTNKSVVNATATASRSVGRIVTASTYSGAWSIAGYVWTCADGASFDGTGTLNLGNGMTFNGASVTFHVGSGVGTVTATSCVLTMNGTTGMTLDDDKSITFKSLTLGANAVVTNSGAQASMYSTTANPLTFTNGGTLTLNQSISLNVSTSAAYWAITGAPTINGNSIIQTYPVANGLTVTIPSITVGGTVTLRILPMYGGANTTVTIGGNLVFAGSIVSYIWSDATAMTINNSGNYAISCGAFSSGCPSGTGRTLTWNFGGGTYTCTSFDQTGSLGYGTTNMNFQSSQWSCSGSWTFGSNHTVNPWTSLITVTGTGTDTHNGKRKYDYTITNSGTGARTFADACTTSGDIIITDGKLAGGGNSIYSVGDFLVTSNDSVKLDWLRVGGVLSLGANCIPTFGNNDSLICDSLYFASTNHDSLRGVVVCSSAVFAVTPKYTAGARIVSLKCSGVTGAPVGLPITYSCTADTNNCNGSLTVRNGDSLYLAAAKFLIVQDSLVYGATAKINGGAGARILTVPGDTITIRQNSISNAIPVRNRGARIRWR